MFLPLKGVRVLDCSALIPGPYCTMILAELGADVIKVEKVGQGDLMRSMSPLAYDYLNGNKRLITLDLKQKRGVDLLFQIAKTSDVFVEGFRPGIVKRLGIDFDSVKEINPSIIYCSISGYGQTGPYRDLPGHDVNYQGLSGLFSIAGDPDGGFEFPSGLQTADIAGSMYAVIAILAALRKPKRSPAMFLDVALAEGVLMWMMLRFTEFLSHGKPLKGEWMGRGPYGLFETRDGKHLTLGIVEDHFWVNLCRAVGLDDLVLEESLKGWHARNRERSKINPKLREAIKKEDLAYWLKKFMDTNIPAAPVTNLETWMDIPQFQDRGFVPVQREGKIEAGKIRRFPVPNLTNNKEKDSDKAPVGRDNFQILSELGISEQDIRVFMKEEVI